MVYVSGGWLLSESRKKILICWIIALLFIELFAFYSLGVEPRISYLRYKKNIEKYELIEAEVVETKWEQQKFFGIPLYKMSFTKLRYNLNGYIYTEWTTLYPDIGKNKHIEVAINKYKYNDLARVVPYITSSYEKQLYLKYIIVDMFIGTIIIVWWLIKRNLNRKILKEYNKKYGEKTKYEENIKNNQMSIAIKKEKIIEYISKNFAEKKENLNLLQYEESNIFLNQDSLWYMEQVKKFNCEELLLLSKMENRKYCACNITQKLRNIGLPDDFYVIEEKDTYYLCCQTMSKRIYAFSKPLGITNTSYADIYDYLLEKINQL